MISRDPNTDSQGNVRRDGRTVGLANRLANALANILCRLVIAVGQQYGKLFTAPARDQVFFPAMLTNSIGHQLKHFVAYAVVKCIVNLLEVINIQ